VNIDDFDRKLRGGIDIAFLLLVFFLPLILSTRSSEVFELPKMLFVYAMTAMIAGLWLGRMALRREILIRRTPLDVPILLFLISQMASTIYSIDPYVSWWGWYGRFHGGLWSTISYTVLYYAFVSNFSENSENSDSRKVRKPDNQKARISGFLNLRPSEFSGSPSIPSVLVKAILASGLVVSVYAILQHFGIDRDFWVQDVVNRVFSTQGQPNWLAGYIVMILPLSWVLTFADFKTVSGKRKLLAILLYCYIAILFLALLWTKSRSGLLGLAAADLTFWLVSLAKIRKKEEGRGKKVKEFVFIHLTMLALLLVTNNPVREMLLKNGIATVAALPRNDERVAALEGGITLRKSEHGGTESGDIRRLVWSGAVQLVKQRPILGFGPETFGETYWRVRPKEHNLTSEWNFLYNKAHNEWLNLAANTGLFGLGTHMLLLGWFGVWILKGPALPRQGRALSSYAILAALLGVEVVNFFGFSTVTVGVYRYMFMGLSVSVLKKKLSDRVSKTLISKVNRWQYLGLAAMAAGGKKIIQGGLGGGLVLLTVYLLFQISIFFWADLEYNRGRAYADAGYTEEAMKPLMRAVNLAPEEPVFRAELGEVEAALVATLDVQRPGLAAADQALSETITQLKKDSLVNFGFVRRQSPENLGFVRTEAKVIFLLGNCNFDRSAGSLDSARDDTLCQQALQLMKLAMEMAPTDPKLPYSLGMMLTKMGQSEETAVYYNKAVELKPDYQEALKIPNTEY